MKTISVTAFKTHCHELLSRVGKAGEPIMITRRGKPIAMLVPPPAEALRSGRLASIATRPRWSATSWHPLTNRGKRIFDSGEHQDLPG